MLVKDPDTGKNVKLYSFKDYLQEITLLRENECDHSEATELRIYTARNGAEHYRPQCLACGRPAGQNVPKSSVEGEKLVRFDLSIVAKYEESRKNERDNILRKHLTKDNYENLRFSDRYKLHMASDKWRAVRKKVIARCNNLCEGCGDSPVNEVHHKTYDNLGHEFLFELLGLCKKCHERLHEDGEEQQCVAISDLEICDEHPCNGCRWQGAYSSDGMMCGYHEKPTRTALAEDGDCGPSQNSFEPLK